MSSTNLFSPIALILVTMAAPVVGGCTMATAELDGDEAVIADDQEALDEAPSDSSASALGKAPAYGGYNGAYGGYSGAYGGYNNGYGTGYGGGNYGNGLGYGGVYGGPGIGGPGCGIYGGGNGLYGGGNGLYGGGNGLYGGGPGAYGGGYGGPGVGGCSYVPGTMSNCGPKN